MPTPRAAHALLLTLACQGCEEPAGNCVPGQVVETVIDGQPRCADEGDDGSGSVGEPTRADGGTAAGSSSSSTAGPSASTGAAESGSGTATGASTSSTGFGSTSGATAAGMGEPQMCAAGQWVVGWDEQGVATCLPGDLATTPGWVTVQSFGATGDGVTDDTAAIQAALDSPAEDIRMPAGTYVVSDTLILDRNSKRLRGAGQGRTVIAASHNGPALQVGTYVYTGADDWDWATHPRYFTAVEDLTLRNTSGARTQASGLDLRGAMRSRFANLYFDDTRVGIRVFPTCHWNQIEHITGAGANANETVIEVIGDGPDDSYNSTGNIYTDIYGLAVTNAAFYAHGEAFGDAVVVGLNAVGEGAAAAVWLESTGAQYYASRMTFSGVDIDGTADVGVRLDGTRWITVNGLVTGGAVTTPVVINGGVNNMVSSPRGLFLGDAQPPISTGGGALYVEDGSLKFKGRDGTVTTIAPP